MFQLMLAIGILHSGRLVAGFDAPPRPIPWEGYGELRDPLIAPLLDRLVSESVEREAKVDHPVALHALVDDQGPLLFVSCFMTNEVLVSTLIAEAEPSSSGTLPSQGAFRVFASGGYCVGDGGGGRSGGGGGDDARRSQARAGRGRRCAMVNGPWGLASHAGWQRLYVASFGSDQVRRRDWSIIVALVFFGRRLTPKVWLRSNGARRTSRRRGATPPGRPRSLWVGPFPS